MHCSNGSSSGGSRSPGSCSKALDGYIGEEKTCMISMHIKLAVHVGGFPLPLLLSSFPLLPLSPSLASSAARVCRCSVKRPLSVHMRFMRLSDADICTSTPPLPEWERRKGRPDSLPPFAAASLLRLSRRSPSADHPDLRIKRGTGGKGNGVDSLVSFLQQLLLPSSYLRLSFFPSTLIVMEGFRFPPLVRRSARVSESKDEGARERESRQRFAGHQVQAIIIGLISMSDATSEAVSEGESKSRSQQQQQQQQRQPNCLTLEP